MALNLASGFCYPHEVFNFQSHGRLREVYDYQLFEFCYHVLKRVFFIIAFFVLHRVSFFVNPIYLQSQHSTTVVSDEGSHIQYFYSLLHCFCLCPKMRQPISGEYNQY